MAKSSTYYLIWSLCAMSVDVVRRCVCVGWLVAAVPAINLVFYAAHTHTPDQRSCRIYTLCSHTASRRTETPPHQKRPCDATYRNVGGGASALHDGADDVTHGYTSKKPGPPAAQNCFAGHDASQHEHLRHDMRRERRDEITDETEHTIVGTTFTTRMRMFNIVPQCSLFNDYVCVRVRFIVDVVVAPLPRHLRHN